MRDQSRGSGGTALGGWVLDDLANLVGLGLKPPWQGREQLDEKNPHVCTPATRRGRKPKARTAIARGLGSLLLPATANLGRGEWLGNLTRRYFPESPFDLKAVVPNRAMACSCCLYACPEALEGSVGRSDPGNAGARALDCRNPCRWAGQARQAGGCGTDICRAVRANRTPRLHRRARN
jgi:hypothetical protein